jgi:hypothetical protein
MSNKGKTWRWADVKPCGTASAYRRHLRHGEKACFSCRQAEARRRQDARDRARMEATA